MNKLTVLYMCRDCHKIGMQDITIYSLEDNIPLQIKCAMQFSSCQHCSSRNIEQLRAVHSKDKYSEFKHLNRKLKDTIII
jgi:hypothetical protein